MSQLPSPGTASYFPTLLAHVRAAHPALPLDPVILQTLLLSLVARIPPPGTPLTTLPSYTSGTAGSRRAPTQLIDPPISAASRSLQGICANLILRTREEDVSLLVHLVSLTLTVIFGLSTHKHKIPSQSNPSRSAKEKTRPAHVEVTQTPDAFLRALFLRRPSQLASPRNNADLTPRGAASTRPTRSPASTHARQRSLSQTTRPSPLRTAQSIDQEHADGASADYFVDEVSLASSRRPLLASFGPTPSSTLRSRRTQVERTRTDPLPLSLPLSAFASPFEVSTSPTSPEGRRNMPEYVPAVVREAEAEIGRAMPTLPKAVVVSGLEHAGLPAQRALLQVLAERKLVIDEEKAGFNGNPFEGGTWNLPDDFLMVYICKSDSRERPALLRGLIDKFSMSVDVVITPSTRQAYAAYRVTLGGTPHTSPFPTSQALPYSYSDAPTPISPLRSPSFRPSILPTPTTIPTPTTSAPPPIPPSELDALRALASPSPPPDAHAHTAAHPALTTYLRDLFSAARHHPALDGTLLTRRAHADAEALARAYRVLAGDSLGAELVAESARALHGAAEEGVETRSVGGAASVRSEWSKDVDVTNWALVDEDEEDLDRGGRGSGGGGRAGDPGRAAEPLEGLGALDEVRSLDVGSPGQMMLAPEVWDVSEVDVARVFPRVVSHRLRVRDGPADEILGSLMWPAAGGKDAGKWERKTVKEVLIEILADV